MARGLGHGGRVGIIRRIDRAKGGVAHGFRIADQGGERRAKLMRQQRKRMSRGGGVGRGRGFSHRPTMARRGRPGEGGCHRDAFGPKAAP